MEKCLLFGLMSMQDCDLILYRDYCWVPHELLIYYGIHGRRVTNLLLWARLLLKLDPTSDRI